MGDLVIPPARFGVIVVIGRWVSKKTALPEPEPRAEAWGRIRLLVNYRAEQAAASPTAKLAKGPKKG